MKDTHILCRGAASVRGASGPRSSSSGAICDRSPGRFAPNRSQPAERSTPTNEFAVSPRSMHHQPIDPRDWTQAYRLLGSRTRLPILSLTAQSSEKCDSCGALTVEPAAACLLGQDLQRSATADRSFEPATKLPNRLDPAVVFQMQSLQDRLRSMRAAGAVRESSLCDIHSCDR
jgi:hypothetical protein